MAKRLPPMNHSGVVGVQTPEACCPNNDGKVMISIDDTALLRSPMESTRARSLNRLDNFDDGEAGVDIYRCPSFPRLQKRCGSQIESQTNYSMTHLETNSISPRVSTDNLTADDTDASERPFVGGAALMRSVSSKTVDELPPLELAVSRFERLGRDHLSPGQPAADKALQPVSRSTSCPSMAYARRSPSPHPVGVPAGRLPEQRAAGRGPVDAPDAPANRNKVSINLEGNELVDYDHAPSRTRPELPAGAPGTAEGHELVRACEEHPMHTKRLLEKQRDRLSLIKQNGELFRNRQISFEGRQSEDRARKECNYVNIRDIPSAVAEKVMDKTSGSTRAVHTVQKKCLQWLNSLDNDDSS